MHTPRAVPYGIPTKYGFVNFRSRLEARWAAFFDLCGWSWTYEPFDLPGWIPDFELSGPAGSCLVEVKPVRTIDEFQKVGVDVFAANPEGSVLVLGVSPLWDQHDAYGNGAAIGLTFFRDVDDRVVFDAQVIKKGAPDFPIDLCSQLGSYQGVLAGHYDGHRIGAPEHQIKRLWAEACNQTQWKAVTPR